ncbi:MAG: CBS domain-containing protein [Candidatus Cloacimonetes bacterium]|nr:CBS domain-containing protein [Candidatus Cloacimonadota bacterium]
MILFFVFVSVLCLFLGRLASAQIVFCFYDKEIEPEEATGLGYAVLSSWVWVLPALLIPQILLKLFPSQIPAILLVYFLLSVATSVLIHAGFTQFLYTGKTLRIGLIYRLFHSIKPLFNPLVQLEHKIYGWFGLADCQDKFNQHLRVRIQQLNFLRQHGKENPDSDERVLILMENLQKLVSHTASEILKPMARIVTVRKEMSISEGLELASVTGFSRLPVVSEDGKIEGIFRSNQLEHLNRLKTPIGREMDEALMFESETSVYHILKRLQEQRRQLGIIKKNGEPLGIITLEDILELVVGEIQDEFDKPQVVKLDRDSWVIDADVSMGSMKRILERFPSQNLHMTLGQYIAHKLNSSVNIGDFIDYGGYILEVLENKSTGPKKVKVHLRKH